MYKVLKLIYGRGAIGLTVHRTTIRPNVNSYPNNFLTCKYNIMLHPSQTFLLGQKKKIVLSSLRVFLYVDKIG